MSNSVLVFEENKAIQGLIASTISDQVELWQESRPDAFLQLADRYSPNLIFISNADQQQDYALCRQLQQHSSLSQVPKVLLVNARDDVNESLLEQFGLQGMIRKPFEAATLQEHIQRYLPSVELQSEPMDSAEEVNVFDDEMLGLIQDNGESVDETMFDEDTSWSGSATGELPEEDVLDEDSPVSLPNVSDQAAAPKQIHPPVVEEDSVPDVDFAEDIAEEEDLNADETEIVPSVAVAEDLGAEEIEITLSAENDSSDEDEEIQSLDELLGAEAAMEKQPGLVQHDDMVLNAKEGLSLVDLEGEIMDSEQNEIEDTLTDEASTAEAETDTAAEENLEPEESEGPFADLDLALDEEEELLDASAMDAAEEVTEELEDPEEEPAFTDSDSAFEIPPAAEWSEEEELATDASEELESTTNDGGFEIPPLELDEEQDLTMLAEEWEEPLSSVEGDDDMEIPPLEMSEEEEDLLVDDWQEAADVSSEESSETEDVALAPDELEEDEDDFALFEEIDEDDWKEAAVAAKAAVEATPTVAPAVSTPPVKEAYRGPIITSSQGLVMDNVDIHQNDFDVDLDIWSRTPDVDQVLRDDVTPISLNENDFDPVLPALSTVEVIQGPLRTRYTPNVREMDYYLAATTLEDEELAETLTNNDSVLLTESGEATGDGGLAAVVEDFEATVALAIGADDKELEEFHLTLDEDDELVPEPEEEEFTLVEEELPDSSAIDPSVEEEEDDLSADEIEHPDLFAESDLPLLDETEETDVTESEPAQEEVIKDETPVVEKKKWRRQVFEQDLEELQPPTPVVEEIAPEEEIELPIVEDEFLAAAEVDSSEEVDEEDELAAESMLSELEGLDQEMADLEQQEVELTEIPEDEALVTLDDEISGDPMAEGEPEVLEEEAFEDWGDAVEALEEESEEVGSAEPEGEPEVLEEETFEDWGDAVEALEEESEEVASVEPEGEPEVLEEETFEDWGDAVEALEEESEEVASAEPEGDPEVLEEETFEDWGDAVEALEEESDGPPPVETPAVAASTDTEVPAGMGSLDTVIEGMITRSVQKAVADAMPQIVERIVQELRQPRP
ncbi:MAG: hypothetical protein VXY74_07445 [SAR324 cluster bacterium]|nr:hypothetical protein [SAR324 cluster bacterium]